MKKRIFALLLALTFVLMTASVGLAAQTRATGGQQYRHHNGKEA